MLLDFLFEYVLMELNRMSHFQTLCPQLLLHLLLYWFEMLQVQEILKFYSVFFNFVSVTPPSSIIGLIGNVARFPEFDFIRPVFIDRGKALFDLDLLVFKPCAATSLTYMSFSRLI